MNSSNKSKAFLQVQAAVMLFGGAGLFAKLIPFDSSLLVWGRTAWAALFLLIWMFLRGEGLLPIRRKDLRVIFVLGGLLAFHWVAFFQSIKLSTVAVGVLTFSSFPVFTVLLAPLIRRDKIWMKDLLLATLAVVGVLVIVPVSNLESTYAYGVFWGLASAASFAVLALYNKAWVQAYSANKVALFQNSGAMLCLLPFTFFCDWSASPMEYGYWILLGVVFTGISHTLFIASLKTLKPQFASLMAALEPVYGILWALLLLGEEPSSREILGGLIILLSAFLAVLIPGPKKSSLPKEES